MRLGSRAVCWLLMLTIVGLAAPGRLSAQGTAGRRTVAAVADRDVRDWDSQITRMERSDELRVRRTDEDGLVPGRTHERFDQYYDGIRVVGGELVRQLEKGQTLSVFGTVYAGISVDSEPAMRAEDAADIVAELTGVTLPAARVPDLVVLPRDDGGYALTYRARVMTASDLIIYYIDAQTGDVVLQYSDLETTVGTGKGVLDDTKKVSTTLKNGTYIASDKLRPPNINTYDMKGSLTRTNQYLNGQILLGDSDFASDSDDDWTDQAAVDAHAYAGWTYDYYYKRFNRQGLNNRNLAMTSLVHPVKREEWASQPSSVLNLYYLNAFYAGDGVMVYGEGLPPNVTAGGMKWNYFSGALDVVAHELTHGVTDYTSGLIYRNESGALNEAFSDIMGASAEFYYQPLGNGYLKADYLLGEDLTSPLSGFRSMANPQAFGDPDHYSKRYLGSSDNGGVHTNSGIANQAFYLAVEGGTNRTSGLAVTGVGSANRDKIEKVFYRAFTQMLPANATFAIARAATIQAARDLYGTGSDVDRAVTQAWTAVGVN
ncbi:MAG: M4 family metallopeptidase [Acidobacteria bacterium]|nr:M4 family metallopeptidase [Acidobacteriota bacterium]